MKISTIKHFFSDALKSLHRNKTISTAAVATVSATLFILGVFMLAILNVNMMIKEVESKVEAKVFLSKNVTYSEQREIEDTLKNIKGVKSVDFETKMQALENVKNEFGMENKALLEGMDKENPFPESYVVKIDKPENIPNIRKAVEGMKGVDGVEDGRKVVDKIVKITKTIKIVAAVIFAILIGVSLFLIGNTIKITVYSRRREIGIMKFVGATDWFIRWPFIIEGMIIGIFGAVVATVVLYYGYRYTFTKIANSIFFLKVVSPSYVIKNMLGEFLLGGIGIGVAGSIISIRKFLRV